MPGVDWGNKGDDERAAELVVRYKAGEKRAMEELYELYFDAVCDYMRTALGNEEDARDATQLVFVKTLHGIHSYRPRSGTPFRAWLFRIARNVVLDLKQSARHRHELLEPPSLIDSRRERWGYEEESPLDGLSDTDLEFFIRRLPQAQREVVLLRHVFDMQFKQIAELMDRSTHAVGRLYRAAMGDLEKRLSAVRARRERSARRVPIRRGYKPARVIVSRRFALGGARRPTFFR
jgi:RNA polymerase sigma-70 factor (ECF subfamily)